MARGKLYQTIAHTSLIFSSRGVFRM